MAAIASLLRSIQLLPLSLGLSLPLSLIPPLALSLSSSPACCFTEQVVILTGDIDFAASDAVEPTTYGMPVGSALYSWVSRGGVLVMTAPAANPLNILLILRLVLQSLIVRLIESQMAQVLLSTANNFSAAPWFGLNMSLGARTTVAVDGVHAPLNETLFHFLIFQS